MPRDSLPLVNSRELDTRESLDSPENLDAEASPGACTSPRSVAAASARIVGASPMPAGGAFDHIRCAVQQCLNFRRQRFLGEARRQLDGLDREEGAGNVGRLLCIL